LGDRKAVGLHEYDKEHGKMEAAQLSPLVLQPIKIRKGKSSRRLILASDLLRDSTFNAAK
jgi:hypothetical protein